jgi:hypothetical protein
MRNKKVMRFESRRGTKKKNETFCNLENLFFFLLVFHYSFFYALQSWLYNFLIIMIT